MIGVSFQIKEDDFYSVVLSDILKGLDIQKYQWNFRRFEGWFSDDKPDQSPFEKKVYSGKEFEERIQTGDYYILFGEILAYAPEDDTAETVDTYEEYAKGKCRLIILIFDGYWFDLYCKDEKELERIIKNCEENHYNDIEILTEENNPREIMAV